MSVVEASVPTAHASRYLQQLCKHWSHKLTVDFTPDAGTIGFPNGVHAVLSASATALQVRLEVPAGEDVERMQRVVAEHFDRFAFREAPLPFAWRAAA